MSRITYSVKIETDDAEKFVTKEELMQINEAFGLACSKIEKIGFVSAAMHFDGKSLSYTDIEEMS